MGGEDLSLPELPTNPYLGLFLLQCVPSSSRTATHGREKDQQQANGKQRYRNSTLYNLHKDILCATVSLEGGHVMPVFYLTRTVTFS